MLMCNKQWKTQENKRINYFNLE